MAGTLRGVLIETGASNPKVELTSANGLRVIDASGVTRVQLASADIKVYNAAGNLVFSASGGSSSGELTTNQVTANAASINDCDVLTLEAGSAPSKTTIDGASIESAYEGTLTTILGNVIDTGAIKSYGVQVIGNQGAAVADASGGSTVDAEARTAINTLLSRLRTHGLIDT